MCWIRNYACIRVFWGGSQAVLVPRRQETEDHGWTLLRAAHQVLGRHPPTDKSFFVSNRTWSEHTKFKRRDLKVEILKLHTTSVFHVCHIHCANRHHWSRERRLFCLPQQRVWLFHWSGTRWQLVHPVSLWYVIKVHLMIWCGHPERTGACGRKRFDG